MLKRRFLVGAIVWGLGTIAAGLAPNLGLALLAFGVIGFGNGAVLVYERQIIQQTVSDASLGRVFGFRDSLTAWAFALAFASAGALITALGPRTLLLVAGIGDLLIFCLAAIALRSVWVSSADGAGQQQPQLAGLGPDAGVAGNVTGSKHPSDLLDGQAGWLTLLDDLGDRRHDGGVELRPSVDG